MKKIIVALACITTALFAELAWVDFDDAIEQAKKTDKIVMVMLSREGCPACEYMQDIVFEDKKVMAEIEKSVIPVYLDINNDFIPDGLPYIGTPTFHFMNSHEIKKGRIDGGANVKDFLEELEDVKSKHKK
ncbi:MAG: thioredoxin family protein [Sulfurimonadaceae bacterium]|jgi:thiol:disulfide interchange protein|nr:thioredoxin family protein [Sulfurimonadaceae bacterium]